MWAFPGLLKNFLSFAFYQFCSITIDKFTLVNGDREHERKRESMLHSMTGSLRKQDAQKEYINRNSELE